MSWPIRIVLALVAIVAAIGGALVLVLRPPPPLDLPEQGAVLDGVDLVLPGADGWRREQQRIVIEGDRIGQIGLAHGDGASPFAGHTVIPGLSDLHVHFPPAAISGQTELFALLLLAHGVTAVRDAGDVDGTSSRPALDGIGSGAFPGPRVVACGPFVDGEPPLWDNSIVVRSPDAARSAVDAVADAGYGCVKAYNELDPDSLDALKERARERGIPVIGHTPSKIPFERARLDDVQHMTGVYPPFDGPAPRFPEVLKGWLRMDDTWIATRASQSIELGITHTPTLVVIDRMRAARDYESLRESPDAALLPRFYRDVIWSPIDGMSPARGLDDADFDWLERSFANMQRTLKGLHEAGVELHTGTDTFVAFVVPGAALHRELRLWVDAGIPATDALAASTRYGAGFLGVPGLGTLDVGAPAELAIFREDPTRDIDALATLSGVVRGGRLFTREQLDAQLARYRDHFEGMAYDALVTPIVRSLVASTLPDRPDGETH